MAAASPPYVWQAAPGSTLTLAQSATLDAGATADIAGLTLDPGASVLIAGELDVAGAVLDDGGMLTIAGGLMLVSLELTQGGVLAGAGVIDFTGSVDNQATIAIAGVGGAFQTLTIEAARFANDGVLRADPYGVLQVAGPTTFEGLASGTLSGGEVFADGGTIWLGGLLAAGEARVVTDAADLRLVVNPYVAAGAGNAPFVGVIDAGGVTRDVRSTLGTVAAAGTLFAEGMTYVTALAITDAGVIELQEAAFASGGLHVVAGGRLGGYGTVAGGLVNDGTIVAGFPGDGDKGALVASANTLTLLGDVSGSGSLDVAAALSSMPREVFALELGGASSQNVNFDDHSGTLVLDAPGRFDGRIEGFGVGMLGGATVSNAIVLDGIDVAGASLSWRVGSADGTLSVIDAGTVDASLTFDATYAAGAFRLGQASDLFGDPISDTAVIHAAIALGAAAEAACFVEGTRIGTARGELAVERLSEGDLVRTVSGRLVPVIWVGRRRVDCAGHPNPTDVWPIEIDAGALGEGVPRRALRVSPEHALFLDGVLVPARALVNGTTIRQVSAGMIAYFHVALPAHDVLLAEGAPAESYLDTGNRGMFANAGFEPGAGPPGEAYAAFVESGPLLDAIRSRVRGRRGSAVERRALLLRGARM